MASAFSDALSHLDAERLNLTKVLPVIGNPGGSGSGSGGGGGDGGYPTGPITTTGGQSPGTGDGTTPGGNLPASGGTSGGSSIISFLTDPVGTFFGPQLLRLVLLILGLICVIGAIYLYKDTRGLVTAPVKAAAGVVKAAAQSAAAAAKAGAE